MLEFYRVMKKGGWGIFQVPINTKSQETLEDKSITDPKEEDYIGKMIIYVYLVWTILIN